VPYEFYIETSAELIEMLDEGTGVDLVSGDTLLLKAGETFDLREAHSYLIQNKTISLIGEAPRPTIKNRNTNGFYIMRFSDNNQTRAFLWSNIDIDYDSTYVHGQPFLQVSGYGTSVIEDCDGTLSESALNVMAKLDTVRNCDLRSAGKSLELTPYEDGSSMVVDNCTIELQSNYTDDFGVLFNSGNRTSTVTVKNSTFTGGTGKYAVKALQTNQAGNEDAVMTLGLVDNDFGPQRVLLSGSVPSSDETEYKVAYDGNDSDIEDCYNDVIATNGIVILTFTSVEPWYSSGNVLSVSNLGDVASGYTKVITKCVDTFYMLVAFSLEDDDDAYYHEIINTPVVKYGNTSGAVNSYATVFWNSGINEWNAVMDLTGITSPIYWNCRVTLCDSTETGATESTAYTLKGAGPCWTEDFMGGGGDPEEEEEEEEQ